MKKKSTQKIVPYLDYECKVGEKVQWTNMKNEKFEGVIKSWDDNVATVQLSDGSEQSVKC
jgi:hypothetical protein